MTPVRRLTAVPHRRRVAAVSTAAVLVAGAAVAVAPAADASGTQWVHTATKALNLNKAVELGAVHSAHPLRLTVGLTPRNKAGIMKLIRAQNTRGSSEYGKFLTPAQFTARFAATQASADKVAGYLRSQGMKSVKVTSNRLMVTANATAGQAEKAFHTSISRFRQGGREVLANTAAADVPASLAGAVSGVLGLSTLGMHTTGTPTPSTPNLSGFSAKTFSKVYDATGTKQGAGTSLAIIAEGDLTGTIKDLRTAEAQQKQRQVPVTLVPAGISSSDTSGADEWDLDTQTSTGIASNAKNLYIYVATSLTDSDLARALNLFASQDKAQAGSASLGECDIQAQMDGSTTIDDMTFAEAAVQGQTFFASTGDTGASCAVLPTNGAPGTGPIDTEYPASSPYVLGVGGTTLLASAKGVYSNEIAWYAGGGGVSAIENAPYWQDGVAPSASVPEGVVALRGLPDVAFDADPNTGENVIVNGTSETIGGTSLASPLALGLWTRLQSTHGNTLGFAPPKLYGLYKAAQGTSPTPPTSVPGFHDIVIGDNAPYPATIGYDYDTGLGSWDVDALSKALG